MATVKKTKNIWEFGDFQTPNSLATQVMAILKQINIHPASIIEPSCGEGNFLVNTVITFPKTQKIIGVEINPGHFNKLKNRIKDMQIAAEIDIQNRDFFEVDWNSIIDHLPQPILIVGNPPWVTNSELGVLNSSNTPQKSNFQGMGGIESITGKSNFDISEWMILQNLTWLQNKIGFIAVLCKTSVARKILLHAWKGGIPIEYASIHKIDARFYFEASVDACLFILKSGQHTGVLSCDIYDNISDERPVTTIGYQDNLLLADVKTYQHLYHLRGIDPNYTWRSGIKHDCSKVMELTRDGSYFVNGYNEREYFEEDLVFPLLKSSDVANARINHPTRYVIVTQKHTGEDTINIKKKSPHLWNYLQKHKAAFDRRGSSIYKNRPAFSIFGVGDYTFTPWKVAISGFYKHLDFVVVGPYKEKPVVFDDTVAFLSCSSQEEADFIKKLLYSQEAQNFLKSMIFWEEKRPITIDILKRLNLQFLACMLGCEQEYIHFTTSRRSTDYSAHITQLSLLDS